MAYVPWYPSGGTWKQADGGHWLHVESGGIWPTLPPDAVTVPSKYDIQRILEDEFVLEDILDADVIG